jgi:NADH-quinone oxidoreductase subunit A
MLACFTINMRFDGIAFGYYCRAMVFSDNPPIWPVVVYGALVAVLVIAMIGLSHLLGERHSKPGRDTPYESGIQPFGDARVRFDARYYLVGVFFILFDVEGAVILSWAVASRKLGWNGYFGAALFILTLAVGLIYVWRLGGLDWYPFKKDGGRRE